MFLLILSEILKATMETLKYIYLSKLSCQYTS